MPDPTDQKPGPHDPDTQADVPIHSLCEADGQALDAVLAGRAQGADQGPVPAGSADRAQKARDLLALLAMHPGDDPPADLTVRTLDAIGAHEQRQRFTRQVQMLSEPRRTIGVAWHQLAAAAAVFIIGASLLMPVMERQQSDARRVAGAGNLRMTGQSMLSYAADNLGQMPRGHVKPGTVWWDVGRPQPVEGQSARSNTSHLYLLIRQGYIPADRLTCPENPYARNAHLTPELYDWTRPREVSFSYQNQYTTEPLRLEDAPWMAVLADLNPLFTIRLDKVVYDPTTPHTASSRAHRRPGQNVLTADGVVSWWLRPTVDPFGLNDQTDNIWTSGDDAGFYTGRETPSGPDDSFLVP